MKKLVIFVLLLLIVGASLSADESKLFVVTRQIVKIYVHRLGFRVVFQKNDYSLSDFYVPMNWFDTAGGKGIMVKGVDPSYPYFSIFWEEGKFHSIKLYTYDNLAHDSWGDLTHYDGIAERFEIDEIEIDF